MTQTFISPAPKAVVGADIGDSGCSGVTKRVDVSITQDGVLILNRFCSFSISFQGKARNLSLKML